MKWQLAHQALESAVARFSKAKDGSDPAETFAPLAESLWWAVILDDCHEQRLGRDAYRAFRDGDQDGRLLAGLRHARNRLAHDYDVAELLYLTEGASFPLQVPMSLREWRWKPLDELPPVQSKGVFGLEVYRAELERKPARLALFYISRFLKRLASMDGLP